MFRHGWWVALLSAGLGCGGNETKPVVATTVVPTASAPSVVASNPDGDAGSAPDAAVAAPAAAVVQLASKSVPLPGVTPPISYDYLAVDRTLGRVYLAVSNGGSLDVYDIASGAITKVDGFKTSEKDFKGKKRVSGPSSAAVGDGVVYVGDRATNEVCAVDAKTLKLGKCLTLSNSIDGLAYVASAKEVWVTTPKDSSIAVLDASKANILKPKTVVKVLGSPEGFAVDEANGLFFTNLEDKGSSLVINVKDHKVRSTWNPSCGADGPRGVAVDGARGLLFVACTDHIQTLDMAHDGAPLAKLDTGAGVDNIDYVSASGLLTIGAGKAAKVTVARFDDRGAPTVVAIGNTAQGARNAVADANGNVYLPDPANGALLVLSKNQ
jgi:hypothetical protein